MLPANKQIGFFSDAYCVEWAYGKAYLVRKQLAEVLTGKVIQGQSTKEEAISLAKTICYETPQRILKMRSIVTQETL
jgi:ribosomal protein L9